MACAERVSYRNNRSQVHQTRPISHRCIIRSQLRHQREYCDAYSTARRRTLCIRETPRSFFLAAAPYCLCLFNKLNWNVDRAGELSSRRSREILFSSAINQFQSAPGSKTLGWGFRRKNSRSRVRLLRNPRSRKRIERSDGSVSDLSRPRVFDNKKFQNSRASNAPDGVSDPWVERDQNVMRRRFQLSVCASIR